MLAFVLFLAFALTSAADVREDELFGRFGLVLEVPFLFERSPVDTVEGRKAHTGSS